VKSQKLGRGLDALLGEIDLAYENEGSNKNVIIEIPLKEIQPNPYQPRKTFDEKSLQELAESIKEDGLLQPIVVTEDIDNYTIIAGERRFRASKLAKQKTIKAIVISVTPQQMQQHALIENIQREELNAIELAQAYNELIKLHEITHEELAGMIHKSRTHITNSLRLLQLSSKTQKALLDKKISAGHAKVLVGLDEKEQELMVHSIIGQKLSVREVESMIKSMKNEQKKSSKTTPKEEKFSFDSLEEKLKNLDFSYKISQNKLIFEFTSQEKIEEFLAHLR